MQGLPWFDRPPVVETVLGVQFEPIPGLSNAHLGKFWSLLGDPWPKVQDVSRLEQQFEVFGDERVWTLAGPALTLTSDPSRRFQIRNQAEDRMIQVQNGRFHYNWLDKPGGSYPRYEKCIKPEFEEHWGRFRAFLKDNGLSPPEVNQWEVTYVNHIKKGTVWDLPSDWSGVFPGILGGTQTNDVAALESLAAQWHFEIPPRRGRLHVQLIHGKGGQHGANELLRVDLTARGPVEGAILQLYDGLDLGRKTIVLMFCRMMTSKKALDYWGINGT